MFELSLSLSLSHSHTHTHTHTHTENITAYETVPTICEKLWHWKGSFVKILKTSPFNWNDTAHQMPALQKCHMSGMFLLLILVNFWHFQQHTLCQFQSVLSAKGLIITLIYKISLFVTSRKEMCQILCKVRCWTRKSQWKCFSGYGFQGIISYLYYVISRRLHIALVQSGLLRLPIERRIWRITHQDPAIISKHWWVLFPFVSALHCCEVLAEMFIVLITHRTTVLQKEVQVRTQKVDFQGHIAPHFLRWG